MALRSPLRPISSLSRISCLRIRTNPCPKRTFFPGLTSNTPQILTASRELPYSSSRLFDLVADVDSYSQFVPYCQQSRVTHWKTATGGQKLPTQADLRVGWGAFEEVFTSRLVCDPATGLVEARSGEGIEPAEAQEAGSTPAGSTTSAGVVPVGLGSAGNVFASLVTRWMVKPLLINKEALGGGKESSQVELYIKFQFTNPLYAAVSSAVSDKMAGVMIEAFEGQAKKRLRPS
ncbi:Coenzyme Q-binding protein COQ10-like protein [Zalerion maritima]|uniref:Coenzyme Q-binding protein COQ10-like protein n=1 Tax=Zalerion maritima TaxID=339359 RepID=A0AAD5WSD8_9PEZI|nr:Coenzyme Q-binding protein COQ10-like protein [Zalerion maritima]